MQVVYQCTRCYSTVYSRHYTRMAATKGEEEGYRGGQARLAEGLGGLRSAPAFRGGGPLLREEGGSSMRRFVTPRAAVAVAICLVGAGLAGSASAQELGLIYAVVLDQTGQPLDRPHAGGVSGQRGRERRGGGLGPGRGRADERSPCWSTTGRRISIRQAINPLRDGVAGFIESIPEEHEIGLFTLGGQIDHAAGRVHDRPGGAPRSTHWIGPTDPRHQASTHRDRPSHGWSFRCRPFFHPPSPSPVRPIMPRPRSKGSATPVASPSRPSQPYSRHLPHSARVRIEAAANNPG